MADQEKHFFDWRFSWSATHTTLNAANGRAHATAVTHGGCGPIATAARDRHIGEI